MQIKKCKNLICAILFSSLIAAPSFAEPKSTGDIRLWQFEDHYLKKIYDNVPIGTQMCFAGSYEAHPTYSKVSSINMTVTTVKDGFLDVGYDGSYQFKIDTEITLADSEESINLYSCCELSGRCSTGECSGHNFYIFGRSEDVLFVNISEYTAQNGYYENLGEPFVGDYDLNFLVERTECQ